MRFSFSPEQEQFRDEIRRFLVRRSPPAEVRRLMASERGYDPEVWRQLSGQLALTAIHVPERYGGAGFGFVELCIAMEEMGRALLCAPYFASSVLATTALLEGATDAVRRELLPALASGECIATLALDEVNGDWRARGTRLVATPHAGGWRIDGTAPIVLDGHVADRVIVAARAPGTHGDAGITLFQVRSGEAGLERRLLETLDGTRKQAALVFESVAAQPVGAGGEGAAAHVRVLDRAAIALACEMVGGAQALFDATLDHAKFRIQFGRPIGSFQAIKHRLADLLLDLELARSAARHAAAAVSESDPEVPALASLAKATASDMYMRIAAECIQIHGGIGFTWDHDAHLWYRRAKASQVLLGGAEHHRERYLQQVA